MSLSLFVNLFQRTSNLEKGVIVMSKELDELNAAVAEVKAAVGAAVGGITTLANQLSHQAATSEGESTGVDPASVQSAAKQLHDLAQSLLAAVPGAAVPPAPSPEPPATT